MMEPLANYLLKSAVWLTGFAMVYLLFLRNERFFVLKRIWLITGLLFSLLFPLVTFHYNVEIEASQKVIQSEAASSLSALSQVQEFAGQKTFGYSSFILAVYVSGVIVLLLRMIIQIAGIVQLIRRSGTSSHGQARIVKASGIKSPFSFFNYIFINPSVRDADTREILNHETVHIRQKHWFDLILAEALRMVQWINPFAWIYTGFIRQNHEFLADETALQRTSDPAVYRAALLNQLFRAPVIMLSNPFSYSTSKKRFEMMKKIITSPYRKLKLLLILPVIATVFYAFATPEYHFVPVENENHITIYGANPILQKSVKGFVINESKKPMFGVKVTSESATQESYTRQNGSFSIDGVPEKSSLVFTFEGYRTVTLPPDFSRVMEVMMTKQLQQSDEKARFVPPPPPPPSNQQKNPEPLVLIDGVVSPEGLRGIDPNAINTMSVLNGESARAVFGEDGKNGVIVVTLRYGEKITKQGSETTQVRKYIPPPPPPPPPSEDQKKKVTKPGQTNENEGYVENYDGKAYQLVDEMPVYPGGEKALLNYIADNVHYPDSAKKKGIQGKVIVQFIVGPDGRAGSAKVIKGVDPLIDAESIRVISTLETFRPGLLKGKPVNVYYRVPIAFMLK